MPTVHRIYNFSAGPAVLPVPVLEEIQRDLVALPGVGMSILEISHRSKAFESILAETEADIRALAAVPSNYRVLFLQGGASLQFSMVPMNLLASSATADYIDSGSWADKAIKEAEEGRAPSTSPATTKAEHYAPASRAGRAEADAGRGLRAHDVEQHDRGHRVQAAARRRRRAARQRHLVRHVQPPDRRRRATRSSTPGAQKNMGPAGVTIVIIRDDLLDALRRAEGVAADDAELRRACGEQVAVQHAAGLRGLRARPGDEVADRAGRACGHRQR